MKHALMQMQYRFAVIYETLSNTRKYLFKKSHNLVIVYFTKLKLLSFTRMPVQVRKQLSLNFERAFLKGQPTDNFRKC